MPRGLRSWSCSALGFEEVRRDHGPLGLVPGFDQRVKCGWQSRFWRVSWSLSWGARALVWVEEGLGVWSESAEPCRGGAGARPWLRRPAWLFSASALTGRWHCEPPARAPACSPKGQAGGKAESGPVFWDGRAASLVGAAGPSVLSRHVCSQHPWAQGEPGSVAGSSGRAAGIRLLRGRPWGPCGVVARGTGSPWRGSRGGGRGASQSGAGATAEARAQGPGPVILGVWICGLTNAARVWETTQTEHSGRHLCVEQCCLFLVCTRWGWRAWHT